MGSSVQFIGIDFGTFSSKIAWYNTRTGQAEIIKNDMGAEQTPSVVYLGKEVLVGKDAVDMLDNREDRQYVITSIKRDLEEISDSVSVPGRSWPKDDVVARILAKLKQDAEQLQFYQKVTRAVITCPASFSSVERSVLKHAAELAGLEVELLDEPVAAALAYTHMQQFQVGNCVLVYDLGAGTFDLAVLRREKGGTFSPAMSPMGIKRCGGDDFDEALYKYFNRIAMEKLGRHISSTGRRDLRFFQLCRRRKEDISSSGRRYSVEHILDDSTIFRADIDLATFESLIKDKIMETIQLTQECLHRASHEGLIVDTLLLVGGSTRIPLVQKLLRESFTNPGPVFWQHSSIAVALGAAYYAYSQWRPENQYRIALESAYVNRRLEETQIAQLQDLADQLGLSKVDQITIEREVLGSTKEEIWERQQRLDRYRRAVVEAWADRHLTRIKIATLKTLAETLGLDARQCEEVEYSVLDATKEQVLIRQNAPVKYLAALMAAWVDGTLNQEEQAYLFKLGEELNLDEQQRALLEQNVMGSTLETVVSRQHAMEQYRHAVRDFWQKRVFTRETMFQLYQMAQKLDLDDSQIDMVEYEVMGKMKETVFVQEYRATHQRAGSGSLPTVSSGFVSGQKEIFHFIGNLRAGNVETAALTFSGDGRLLACCDRDARVYVWCLDRDTDEILMQQDWKFMLSLIIACDKTNGLERFEMRETELIRDWYARAQGGPYTLKVDRRQVSVMAFSPDARALAIANEDGTIKVWDWYQNQELASFKHKNGVRVLAFSPGGELLASGGIDTTIKLWEWHKSREIPGSPLKSHSQSITSIAFSPNSQFLISGSHNGGIRLWNLASKQPFQPPRLHTNAISAISFRAEGDMFATSSLDQSIRLWDLAGNHLRELTGHTDGISTISFSADGLIASGSIRNELIRLWRPDTEKFLQSITGHTGKIIAIAFSPDGEMLITSGASRTINVYERLHSS